MNIEENLHWNKIRKDLNELLKKWLNGSINPLDIKVEIEKKLYKLINNCNFDNLDRNNPFSIIIEVMEFLDAMYFFNIIEEDIPIIIEFLNTPTGSELKAWDKWENYWENINIKDKKRREKWNKWFKENGWEITT